MKSKPKTQSSPYAAYRRISQREALKLKRELAKLRKGSARNHRAAQPGRGARSEA